MRRQYVGEVPSPLASNIPKLKHTRYSIWRRPITTISFARLSQFPQRSWPFPSCPLWTARPRCHGHSLLLFSYLCRIKKKNSCSACGHQLQNLTHLLMDYPASEPLRRAILESTSSRGILLRPHSPEGISNSTTKHWHKPNYLTSWANKTIVDFSLYNLVLYE